MELLLSGFAENGEFFVQRFLGSTFSILSLSQHLGLRFRHLRLLSEGSVVGHLGGFVEPGCLWVHWPIGWRFPLLQFALRVSLLLLKWKSC